MEQALFERPDRPVLAAGPFREGDHRFSLPDLLRCLLQAFHRLLVILPVDFDVSGTFHGLAEDRDLEEFLLDDPAELSGDVGQDDQDVEIALVVGHEDLRPVHQHVFAADHIHLDAGEPEKHLRPQAGDLVRLVLTGGDEREEISARRHEGGDGDGKHDQQCGTNHDRLLSWRMDVPG